MSVETDSAQVRIPPPILILVCLIAGWGVEQFQGAAIVSSSQWAGMRSVTSGALIAIGFALIGACAWQFKRAQTCIEPWRPTSSIIKGGLYRYSRNPIYVGFVIVGIGFALAFNTLWMLVGVIVFVAIATKYVIAREEKYLEAKFGEAYSDYRRETRRWL
jgi:protein-S-isoprenylcysteine O-methyltransferase Ste14